MSSSSSAPSRAIMLGALMAQLSDANTDLSNVEIIEDQPEYIEQQGGNGDQMYIEEVADVDQETILVDENGHQLTPEEVAALGSNVEFLDQDAGQVIDQPMMMEQAPAPEPQPEYQMQQQPEPQMQQQQQMLMQQQYQPQMQQQMNGQELANPEMQNEVSQAEMRLHVPSTQESSPLDTNELADAVKAPVLDNDYKSILLDITKMVAQARFIMSRAFVGGNQLGGSSFLQQGAEESLGAQDGPTIEDTVESQKVHIPARPHRALKRDPSVLAAGEQHYP